MPALLIVMQLITLALAQKSTNASPNRLAQETHSKKPVLTEKQKRGLHMLDEAQVEAFLQLSPNAVEQLKAS